MKPTLSTHQMHSVVEGWIYECQGPRGGKYYYPYDRLELPLELGDKVNMFSPKGLDIVATFAQLAELVGAAWIDELVVISDVLVTDGNWYSRPRTKTLKAINRSVKAHNDRLEASKKAMTDYEADNAQNIVVPHSRNGASSFNFIQNNVQPGWFARIDSCSIWVEIVAVYDTALMVIDRRILPNRTVTYVNSYSVDVVRATPPKYGNIIRADGTANYVDKFYPRTYRA